MEQVGKERVRQKAEKDIKEQERLSAGQKAIEENASQEKAAREKAAREKAAEEEETGSVASDEGRRLALWKGPRCHAGPLTNSDHELLFEERASVILGGELALFLGVVKIIFTLIREMKEVLQTNNEVRPSNELRPSY
jgi:hypothetical protein